MKATIHRYLHAVRRRREDGSEQGFSLIELIVVVAILGILVAIAIPVFTSIDHNAKINSAKASAQNAATSVAAELANGKETVEEGYLAKFEDGDIKLAFVGATVPPTSIAEICVQATYGDLTDEVQQAGPGCTPADAG